MKFTRLPNQHGFTLFELVISITIFSIIMISVFDSVANIGISRIKNTQRISLLEELYFFSEKLTSTIKEGGTIDYEEYWGRSRVGTGSTNGYYTNATLFGNYGTGYVAATGSSNDFGKGLYYCVSGDSSPMGTGGCSSPAHNSLIDASSPDMDYSVAPQRYGEYKLQFTDYNGNQDTDNGDEDGVNGIVGDDDDVDLGDGPTVINNPMLELYLIHTLKKQRSLFRVVYKQDPDAPIGTTCTVGGIMDGCVGNVQVLKMNGKDIGVNHDGSGTAFGTFDGDIDTWVCDPDWKCPDGKTLSGSYGVVPLNNNSDWVDLFPDYINVKSLRFYIYPLQNPWLSWKAADDLVTSGFTSPFLHPYVRMELTLGFAWKRRSIIKNDDPTITISTTINLEDYGNE